MVSHVADLQLVLAPGFEHVEAALTTEFGLEWELALYMYCGCEHYLQGDAARITQREFIQRRMELIDVARGRQDGLPTYEERVDNQSAVGSLSWLSAQTRPDLSHPNRFLL